MRTTNQYQGNEWRGVEPLEQRVCLSAGRAVHFQFAYATTTTQHVQQPREHHHFTAMSWSGGGGGMMAGGSMAKMTVKLGDAPVNAGYGGLRAGPPMMGNAIARALEQLARQMMKEMQQGWADQSESGIGRNSVKNPGPEGPGFADSGGYVFTNPEAVNSDVVVAQRATGTVEVKQNGPNANQTQSNVIVTASVRPIEVTRNVATVVPKTRVAAVETGGRAVEILETTSAVATRTVVSSAATIASIGTQASGAVRELWTIVTGGGETTVSTPASGEVLASANSGAAIAAKAAVAVVPNVTVPKMFEFAHLGSPMTLLADSMAGFIEDSAAIPMATGVAASARSQMPWLVTACVIAADIVLLTYMHTRRKRSRSMAVPAMHY